MDLIPDDMHMHEEQPPKCSGVSIISEIIADNGHPLFNANPGLIDKRRVGTGGKTAKVPDVLTTNSCQCLYHRPPAHGYECEGRYYDGSPGALEVLFAPGHTCKCYNMVRVM